MALSDENRRPDNVINVNDDAVVDTDFSFFMHLIYTRRQNVVQNTSRESMRNKWKQQKVIENRGKNGRKEKTKCRREENEKKSEIKIEYLKRSVILMCVLATAPKSER